MKLTALFIAALLLLGIDLQAQDIKNDLAGTTTSYGFTVHAKGGDTVFTVRGNGLAGFPGIVPTTRLFVKGDALNGVTGTTSAQDGIGVLGVSTTAKGYAGAFDGKVYMNDRLGIGTASPTTDLHVDGQVRITGGSPGVGKVLTSDATGLATWTTPATGGNTLDGAYDQGGAGAGRTITADAGAVTVAGVDGFLSTGTFGQGAIPATGAGTRMMWYPKKATFRVGHVTGSQWDDSNIGYYSFAFGYDAKATQSMTFAVGEGAAASGAAAIALGSYAEASGDKSVAIGRGAEASGSHSTAIGFSVTASGESSTALGNYVSTSNKTGAFIIGDASTISALGSSSDNQFSARFAGGYRLYTNSTCTIAASMGANANSWGSISDSTRKENFLAADAEAMLSDFRSLRLGSWNYIGNEQRHYGPMAQEWFAAFGRDGIGRIGDDTTLASADVDGVLCIAVKALEQRTTQLRTAVTALQEAQMEIAQMKEQVSTLQKKLTDAQRRDARVDELERLVRNLQKEHESLRLVKYSELTKEDAR
jgi:FtsZ-binding cell division protein ZapB